MNKITFISGLFRNIRNGITTPSPSIFEEIKNSIHYNPQYKDMLTCYADCQENAEVLSSLGLKVHKVLTNSPIEVIRDSRYKMKHLMVLEALKEFDNIVWVDWDTYNIKPIDEDFTNFCFQNKLPKFTWIPGDYWATVNCAVYYCNCQWIPQIIQSFSSIVSEPNDELMWKSVLPNDIRENPAYWMKDLVVNIWDNIDFKDVSDNTYFLHLKNFEMINDWKRKI